MNEDGVLTWAAAMAYSWMFALFPLVIFLLTLVAFLPFDSGRMVEEVNRVIQTSLPAEAAKILTDRVPEVLQNQRGGLLTIGALLTLFAASGGMAMTMSALNRCYDIIEDQPFYVARPKAIVLTLCVLALVLVVLTLLPVTGIVLAWIKAHSGALMSAPLEFAFDLARWIAAMLVMFFTVALIYYFGPRMKEGFRFITPGGLFTVVAWVALGLGFKFYITHWGQSYGQTYGAVGGALILLLFLYLSSLVLLLGAEINSEFDFAMYGRTGGLAVKPGAEEDSDEKPNAKTSGPLMSPAMGKAPKAPAPPAPSKLPPIAIAGMVGMVGLALGYVLKKPPYVFKPRLTPRRRLRQAYPATYAALKAGL